MTTYRIPDKSAVTAIDPGADVFPVWQGAAQHTATAQNIVDAVAPWKLTTYNATIPLDACRYMARMSVTGAIAFTPSSTLVAGAECHLTLIADAVNTPTFTGFKESGASAGYNNTLNIDNQITFWYDGTYAWYAVLQEANAQVLLTPALQTAIVANASPTVISLTYQIALSPASVPATSAFSIASSGGAITVSSVSIASSVVTLNLSRAVIGTETLTVSYTVPGLNKLIAATGSVPATALVSQAVTNQVITLTPVLQSAIIANGAPNTIALLYQVALNTAAVPATSAFSITASGGAATVSSATVVGSTVNVVANRSFAGGETVTISYTVPGLNPITANSGAYYAAALVSQAVTDNISTNVVVRFDGVTVSITESADPTFGYDYTTTQTWSAGGMGISNKKIPLGANGFVGALNAFPVTAPSFSSMFGIQATLTNGSWQGIQYGLWSQGGAAYGYVTSGASGAHNGAAVVPAANDIILIRVTGSTITGEVSKDGGATYTVVHTWTGAPITNDWHAVTFLQATNDLKQIFGSANVV